MQAALRKNDNSTRRPRISQGAIKHEPVSISEVSSSSLYPCHGALCWSEGPQRKHQPWIRRSCSWEMKLNGLVSPSDLLNDHCLICCWALTLLLSSLNGWTSHGHFQLLLLMESPADFLGYSHFLLSETLSNLQASESPGCPDSCPTFFFLQCVPKNVSSYFQVSHTWITIETFP